MNLQRTKKFVNPTQLYITCEKSGGLHQAEPSLTAGRQSVHPADEIWARLEILKAYCRSKYSIFRFVLPRYCIVSVNLMHLYRFFQVNISTRLFYKV